MRLWGVALLAVASACGKTKAEYARLAADVSPVVTEMQALDAKIAPVDAPPERTLAAMAQTRAACERASDAADKLAAIDASRYAAGDVRADAADLSSAGAAFLGAWRDVCEDPHEEPFACVKSCVEAWTKLGLAVNRVAEGAAREGVAMPRLHLRASGTVSASSASIP